MALEIYCMFIDFAEHIDTFHVFSEVVSKYDFDHKQGPKPGI